jgi:hypothetical protein
MSQSILRPAAVCKALLTALEASEGRRRSRKRDQTPDGIGLTFKRELLEQAVSDDPEPEAFEQWLLDYTAIHGSAGGIHAMARAVFEEWRLTHSMNEFKSWLEQGAPSDDAKEETSSPATNLQHDCAKGRP